MFDINTKTSDYLNLIVTHECNLKCPFCVDQYRGESLYISEQDVKKALDFARDSGHIKDILLIGGEPTLHPYIVEIAKTVKEYGFNCIMTTNYKLPDVVKELDGIVDSFNISYYSQKTLPKQSEFKSDLTLHTLIHKKQLNTKEKLDAFIALHSPNLALKFSTLTPCNDWAARMQRVSYLDELESDRFVLFNEIIGQRYKDSIIKRYDLVVNDNADQSYKAHTDGQIIQSWTRC